MIKNLLREYINEVIRKCRYGDSKDEKQICLYAKDGSRLLGRHKSKKSAQGQERAIKANGG